MGLRSAHASMEGAVAETLDALGLTGSDRAVARLARVLALALDDDGLTVGELHSLSGRLLGVLVELGATPRSRGTAAAPAADDALTRLRAARGG